MLQLFLSLVKERSELLDLVQVQVNPLFQFFDVRFLRLYQRLHPDVVLPADEDAALLSRGQQVSLQALYLRGVLVDQLLLSQLLVYLGSTGLEESSYVP